MKINKKMLLVILASVIGNIIVYPFMPEKIPHSNLNMVVDGYSGKWTLFLMPLTTIGMYFLLFFLSKLDKRSEMNKTTYELITNLTVLFFIVMNIWLIFYSMGYNFDIIRIMNISLGVVFIILGNYMPRIKMNSVFGIRTPWTLNNEDV